MATNNATFVSQHVPTKIAADLTDTVDVQVTMRNTGDTVWETPNLSSNPHRLGSQNPQDNQTWGLNRVDLSTPVSPGDEYTFSFTITVPSPRRTFYDFQWRMVQDGVAWFGDSTPDVKVDVYFSRH